MSPINVLWVIDHVCYDGSLHGGGRLFWNVVPRFDPRRVRIVPCFLRATATLRRVFADAPAPVRILDKGKFDLTTVWTLLRLIKKERIDVMHLHCYGASSFGRIAGWIARVPTIVHDYDTEVYFPYPWYLGIVDHLLAKRTSGAIAASPMVRDYAIRQRQLSARKVRIMFHAVPPEKYAPPSSERVATVRQQLGADERTKIVGTVTKLGPQRGNAYFLKAAHEVLRALPQTLFMVVYKTTVYHRAPSKKYVGAPVVQQDQESLAGLKDLAEQLGIGDRIRFIDSWDRSDELIAAMDLMVVPFLSQRFSSVKLLEAMAMGKPIVATEIGEQGSIVQNGINGYLVPPGDVGQLAQRILEMVRRPDELTRFSLKARELSWRYSVDRYVETLQDWYHQLARGRRLK